MFDKKSPFHADKSAPDNGIKKENISNQLFANQLLANLIKEKYTQLL